MRRVGILVAWSMVVLAACSSSGSSAKEASPSTSTQPPTSAASTTTSTSPATSSSSVTTTTPAQCPNRGATNPVTTQGQTTALLSQVAITTSGCQDLVVFGYVAKGGGRPSCRVSYQHPPFVEDASGRPVAVAGSAFVVVRCYPASGFDFEAGTPTYTGPKRVAATGTHHVQEAVQTGDYESVLTWVIGLDARRGFSVSAMGAPAKQLIVTFS